MYLGIMVLLVALLVVYFESKSREQNHKIESMFSIVHTLVGDMNEMKFAVNHIVNNEFKGPTLEENIRPFSMQDGGQLIEVSDDEDDSDNEMDDEVMDDEVMDDEVMDDEVTDDEVMDDEVTDEDVDTDSDSDDDDDEKNINVKVLKISREQEEEQIELDQHEALELDQNEAVEYLGEDVFEEELQPILENEVIDKNKLKTINIDLEDNESEESVDYKKLSLQKLKNVVVEKGLVSDASKLKKPELFKLLGIE